MPLSGAHILLFSFVMIVYQVVFQQLEKGGWCMWSILLVINVRDYNRLFDKYNLMT